ncbi:Ran-binding protein 9 [Chamberlinius hualienensis]
MASATAVSGSVGDAAVCSSQNQIDRLKLLYPMVNEEESPLPRSWSPKDKYNFIGLSQGNLRVHYKGSGKNHKDAASVRATYPIPAACGLYYFEVKIVSKGRDGYMGIGLSAQGVNMNRLPGWDKQSYGYHGDDGHLFNSSGTGSAYGPTFTTGDVIGCGVNLIDNTCFYTKNGHNLGIAFTDLPPNLYPTVGLQTPGEVVDANFGQAPFVFDIEDMRKDLRMKTRLTIERFAVNDRQGEWQTTLHKIVSSYLVHHGFCGTAEAFLRSTGQTFSEEITSIKNRQKIQELVLSGRMGEAIEATQKLYPGLLEHDTNLLFMLKCRQFIEMVNGTDSEVRRLRRPKSRSCSPYASPKFVGHCPSQSNSSRSNSPSGVGYQSMLITSKSVNNGCDSSNGNGQCGLNVGYMNAVNLSVNGESGKDQNVKNGSLVVDNDVDMDTNDSDENSRNAVTNGNATNGYQNGSHDSEDGGEDDENDDVDDVEHEQDREDDMDVDPLPSSKRQLCGGSQVAIERMLQFGRELQSTSVQLRREHGKNEVNKKMLQDAFSLLAYADPWSSHVGYQLEPIQREPVCAALNSAILESHNLPRRPPLEIAISHTTELIKLKSKLGIGSCAFANIDSFLH